MVGILERMVVKSFILLIASNVCLYKNRPLVGEILPTPLSSVCSAARASPRFASVNHCHLINYIILVQNKKSRPHLLMQSAITTLSYFQFYFCQVHPYPADIF